MTNLHVDPALSPADQRAALYAGDLILRTDLPAVAELAAYAREELTTLFAPHPIAEAHEHVSPEEMSRVLGAWKPAFIHSARAKALVCEIVEQAGFSADDTYYDLPKPRTSFPVGHLTTGIAFAFPWHRDTWYSAPAAQLNWWLPVLDVRPDNAMAFDLSRFARPVTNSSEGFDYYAINVARLQTASQVRREVQSRPAAIDHEVTDGFVPLPRPGSILLFSGSQLHASVPNTSGRSRYSIDFRTVDESDVVAGRGAPLVDVACTGTSLRDFARVSDGERIDEALVQQVYGPPPAGAVLVFEPPTASTAGPA